MPKVAKPSQVSVVPVRSEGKTLPLLAYGYAVAIADIASKRGITVAHVMEDPVMYLQPEGIPDASVLSPSIVASAHRIYRDRIDAMLYRCNRPLSLVAPVLTEEEAKLVVAYYDAGGRIPDPSTLPGIYHARSTRRDDSDSSSASGTQANGTVGDAETFPRVPSPPARQTRGGRTRNLIFGYPAKYVVYWMGANGLGTVAEVERVLARYGSSLAVGTIKQFLGWCRDPDTHGDPADLSIEQQDEVRRAAKGVLAMADVSKSS